MPSSSKWSTIICISSLDQGVLERDNIRAPFFSLAFQSCGVHLSAPASKSLTIRALHAPGERSGTSIRISLISAFLCLHSMSVLSSFAVHGDCFDGFTPRYFARFQQAESVRVGRRLSISSRSVLIYFRTMMSSPFSHGKLGYSWVLIRHYSFPLVSYICYTTSQQISQFVSQKNQIKSVEFVFSILDDYIGSREQQYIDNDKENLSVL